VEGSGITSYHRRRSRSRDYHKGVPAIDQHTLPLLASSFSLLISFWYFSELRFALN